MTLGTTEMDNFAASAIAMFGGADNAPNKEGAGAPPPPAGKSFSATTDAGGKFRFEGVDPGDYVLRAKHTGYSDGTYKPTVRSEIGGQLHVSLSNRVGEPAGASTVVLLTADPALRLEDLTKSEDADDTGRATFVDVPPGDYLAIAWQDVEQGAWYDPDFVKRYEKDAKRIVVSPKGKRKIEL